MTAAVAASASDGGSGTGECPELSALERVPLPPAVQQHVEHCAACRLVVDVFSEGRPDLDDCPRFDALLAARAEGILNAAGMNLLERHLASCEACRAVAETLSPLDDTPTDHTTLPKVDPAGYALGLEVGRGGMGRVIAARDLRVGRPVAVKELLGRSPQLAARFEREARVTARLQHPGIVPIYEIGRWPDGTPFYSMRMVDGRTLAAAIGRAKTLQDRLSLLPAVIAACEAVAFAHGQRVIHRDLTPANVIVGAYGETVVIDWGLAKDLADATDDEREAAPYRDHDSASDSLTNVGAVVGTAAYMPPEQANAEPVDERADVYALGAILYHLLAGKPPYRATGSEELLRAVKAGPPPAIEQVAPTTPRDLVSIVDKAMARSPAARYPSARELAEELKRFQTGRMVEAHQYSRGELIKRFVRRHRGAVTATALAIVVGATAGTVAIANIVRSNAEARATARELLLEEGRVELREGNRLRALAYLYEAYRQGARGPVIDFLLGDALADLDAAGEILECGGDDRTLDVSPDGKYLAGACHDRARLWRIGASLELVATFEDKGATDFDNLEFSRDGSLLATSGDGGVARIWDVRDPKAVRLVRSFAHRGDHEAAPHAITFATFTPDNRRLATTGNDGYARIWDIATGAKLREIHGNDDPIFPRLFGRITPDGKSLVTLTFDGTGNQWDLETGAKLGTREHGGFTGGGELAPNGRYAASCGLDGGIKIWDLERGTALHTIPGHSDVAWRCVFSADSSLLLTTSHDESAKVWDVATGRLVTVVDHGALIWLGRFSPDGKRFTTVSPGSSIKVWDTASGALLGSHDSRGKDARFLPDGRLAALRGDGRIQIWRPSPIRPHAFSPAPGQTIERVSGDGSCLATVSDSLAPARLWSGDGEPIRHPDLWPPVAAAADRIAARTSTGIAVVDCHGQDIARWDLVPSALELDPTGRRVVMTFADHVELRDVATRGELARWPDRTRVVFAPDGAHVLAYAEPTGLVELRGVEPAATAVTFRPLHGRPTALARDGHHVLVFDAETDTVELWDATRPFAPGRRHTNVDLPPRLDPSGRYATLIGKDRVVTIWDLEADRAWSFATEQLQDAQVNADGTLVAAIGEYGRALLIASATDGRVLARREIEHAQASVAAGGFSGPRSHASWTPDGGSIVTRSKGVATWRVSNPHTQPQIKQLVSRHVPWRVVNGRLELVQDARLAGTIRRGGEPVANASVEVIVRRAADIGVAPINWESMKARLTKLPIKTDEHGEFRVERLVPGEYVLLITANGKTTTRTAYASSDELADAAFEIDLAAP
ncbi:MAG TPA: protein kinase [Kofleriaceae bacterium]|nr:protein kinase [Kofleriaceae bacterium]